jgi:hypothetical protein
MSDHEHPLKSPRIRIWRYLPLLIILGLAVHLHLQQVQEFAEPTVQMARIHDNNSHRAGF